MLAPLYYVALMLIGLLPVSASIASEPLPVGVSPFPPFKYVEDGKVVGSDTEIVIEVLKQMGYQADIYSHPWKRILTEAKSGKYALIYTFTRNEEREKYFYFSDPISAIRDVFFKQADRAIQWDTLDDLRPFIVSASEGYNYHESFNNAAKEGVFKVSWTLGHEPELTHLKLLKAGRVDLAICEVSVCQFLIRKYPDEFSNIDFIDRSVGSTRAFYAGFSKAWPGSKALVKAFNKALGDLVASGKRDEILKRYGVESSP
ncbi:substrate-binding periplasmic protein [Alkalimarinus coralli]|uniref:substrate-binding periplasmic protein n=1 Tax=Alkalimarinus coralli TaxID=2935863 RepID=UPI00202B55FF|nr:transporter substrate-binding domain-containing protein [Alkalimarinus coralli]